MKGLTIRKILVLLIIIAPIISYTGCDKQAKCGCGKDVLFTMTNKSALVYYNEGGTNISMTTLDDPYSTYYFCNPSEMFPKLVDSKSGDQLQVSGHCYWECNYIYQQGNSSYQSYYKIYNIQVTNVFMDLYGKK